MAVVSLGSVHLTVRPSLLCVMWPGRIYVLLVWVWIFMSLVYRPSAGFHQYSADELVSLRFHLASPPPAALHLHTDIAFLPRRKYIHRGSRRDFHHDNSKPIQSLWSTSRHPPRNSDRAADHSVLASLLRLANTSVQSDNMSTSASLTSTRSRAKVI